MPAKLNGFLAETAAAARERFSGPVSYASAPWEPVDWQPFDIAATDAYLDATNADGFRDELRKHLGHGKPLAVTEFGCCYAGAADRGGMGWAIIDESADRRCSTATTCGTKPSRSGTWRTCTQSSRRRAWTWRSGSPSPGTTCRTTPSHARIWI